MLRVDILTQSADHFQQPDVDREVSKAVAETKMAEARNA
jgi:hypothetical protein